MPREDIKLGRIEFDRSPLQNTLDSHSDRRAIKVNRQTIAEVRDMPQTVIDHLGVPYAAANASPTPTITLTPTVTHHS